MEVFYYKGFGNCDSKCGLNVIRQDKKAVVVFTELSDNTGTSVTNIYEYLATCIYKSFLSDFSPVNIMWIEHYPANERLREKDSWTEVTMFWDGQVFKRPKWIPISDLDLVEFREKGILKE